MGRPEQHGKTKMAKAHKGKHGGEIVDGQRREGGAFAPGNSLAKGQGKRISAAMRMRNAFRDHVGEEKIREIADELWAMAMTRSLDPKERAAIFKLILEYTIGKPSQDLAVAAESDGQGNTRIMFVVKDGDNGEVQEL